MYDNYVFDLYGTLADIHTDEWSDSFWEKIAGVYSSRGITFKRDELQKLYYKFVDEEKEDVFKRHPDYKYIDIHIENVFRKIFEYKGISVDDEMIEKEACIFRDTSREYIRLYDGIDELLHELKKHGRVYLLTNAQRSFTWKELELLGIVDIFDGILISSEQECSKPDIHFFKALIDKYSLDPKKTIMVGNDPDSDIAGGKAAGFDTLYIHTNISPEINYNTGCTYFIPDGDTLKMKDYLI